MTNPAAAMTIQKATFGANLRNALKESEISQAKLARQVECTPQYISQLISGERGPSRDIVQKISRALNLPPADLDNSWKDTRRQVQHFEMMQGIDTEYLGAAMRAVSAARKSLLVQPPSGSLLPGSGKADAKLIDSVTEQAIAGQLLEFNSRCAIVTEEAGVIGERKLANNVSYIVDPFDRSRPFARAVTELFDEGKHHTLEDVISDPSFKMHSLEAPSASITCVRDGEIIFNVILDYASGAVYVASKGFIGYGNIDDCPDPRTLAEQGTEITFSPRFGQKYLCFRGDPDKDKELTINEQSSKYKRILAGLGFDPDLHVGLDNPGGPARILYLSDLNEDADNPTFILSNGEKIFEFLGWLAFAIYSHDLAVYELYSAGFEARGNILQAPPPNYSAFIQTTDGFRLNMEKIIDLDPTGHYRGALVVTHSRSTVACALMRAKVNSRPLYHNP